jgi:hypothetical protein
MVAVVKENNMFVGAGPKYWECSQNWETKDGTAAKSAPCGKDRAFFREDHYYHTVESNVSSVSVQYLQVRGELVTTELIPKVAPEFNLNLQVDPRCGESPSLCPCFPDCKPSPSPKPNSSGGGGGSKSGRTAGIVVGVIVVVLVVVALTVLLAVIWLQWRHRTASTPYMKDDLLGEPEDSLHSPPAQSDSGGGALFDNPIYETDGKKQSLSGGGDGSKDIVSHEMDTIAILRPSAVEYEPVEYTTASDNGGGDDDKKTPVIDKYERLP